MKKFLSVIFCLVICCSFIGCNGTNKDNEVAKETLVKVLKYEENFSFKSLVYDKVTEENLEKFNFPSIVNVFNGFVPSKYTFVDFDSNGIEELAIFDNRGVFLLILRYDNGKVIGNILENISYNDIRTNGTFIRFSHNTKNSEGFNAISYITFDGLNCESHDLAYKYNPEKIYKLEDKDASKEEVEKYFEKWENETEKVTWINFEK